MNILIKDKTNTIVTADNNLMYLYIIIAKIIAIFHYIYW